MFGSILCRKKIANYATQKMLVERRVKRVNIRENGEHRIQGSSYYPITLYLRSAPILPE
jgi:hypothetical protein